MTFTFIILNVLILGTITKCNGIIYHLNDSLYYQMPPVNLADSHSRCINEPNGVYCTVEFDLVSDTESPLLKMIQEYSEESTTHENHTHLYYGICLNKTCKSYFKQNATNLKPILEACLNQSFWDDYKLKTKIIDINMCMSKNSKINTLEGVDIIVILLVIAILSINIVGSLYDSFYCKGDCSNGNKLLLNFSLKRNFTKLIRDENDKDPRIDRLKGIHGIRVLSIVSVIVIHTLVFPIVAADDIRDIELAYQFTGNYIFFNASIVVQIFFLISGFLLSYYMAKDSEEKKLNARECLKKLLTRWFRLTPVYAVVLAIRSTLTRFYSNHGHMGPMLIGEEVDSCRSNFWYHLFYIQNYTKPAICMGESWYVAADFQLYVSCLVIFTIVKQPFTRKIIIGLLFIVGVIAPAAHTYLQDLDGTLLIRPSLVRDQFTSDPTFNILYRQGHNNLSGYILGFGMGLIVFSLQTRKIDMKKYDKYNFIYPSLILVCVGLSLISKIFYVEGPRLSIYFRAVYAALAKPLFCVLCCIIFFGMVFKCDNTYRRILEWKGWLPLARVSYCAYLVHVILQRILFGLGSTISFSIFNMIVHCFGIISLSFIVSVPLWMFVEAPLLNVAKNDIIPWLMSDKKMNTKKNM